LSSATRTVRATATIFLAATATVVTTALPAYARFDDQPASSAWQPDGPVHAVVERAGVVYIGGPFTSLRNPSTGAVMPAEHLAALDASTGEPLPGWSASADADVRALAVSPDGTRLLAGGAFVSVGGEVRRHLAALSTADGSVISSWKPSATGMVRDLLVVDDRLYVGGTFSSVEGSGQKGLAALVLSTGERDPAFSAFTDKPVYDLTRVGRSLVAAGTFGTVNGSPRQSLAALDLTSGALSPWAPRRVCASCSTYWDVATDGQRVYVGASGPGGWAGAYALGLNRPRWVTQADGDVQAVTVADGLLYLGGHFRQFNQQPRAQLAAVVPATGAVDPGFAPEMKASYPGVWALTASSDHLYAAGDFEGVVRRGRSPYFAAFPTS